MALARLRLLVGPGTLPSRGKDRMDFTNYRRSGRPRMTAAELLAEIPEIERIAHVEPEATVHEVATLEDLRKLALRVSELLQQSDLDGLVFVQGTNTLEETAYFLTLTVHSAKPVVVTGAQRPFTALSSDAPLNLYNAIRTAAHAGTSGKGVVVVTNDEINCARDVTKTHTYRVQTFRSRDLGLLGYADPDRIVYYRAPMRRHTVESEFPSKAWRTCRGWTFSMYTRALARASPKPRCNRARKALSSTASAPARPVISTRNAQRSRQRAARL